MPMRASMRALASLDMAAIKQDFTTIDRFQMADQTRPGSRDWFNRTRSWARRSLFVHCLVGRDFHAVATVEGAHRQVLFDCQAQRCADLRAHEPSSAPRSHVRRGLERTAGETNFAMARMQETADRAER